MSIFSFFNVTLFIFIYYSITFFFTIYLSNKIENLISYDVLKIAQLTLLVYYIFIVL